MITNFVLRQSNNGIIGINDNKYKDFSKLLTNDYNDETKKDELINYLASNCINNYGFKSNLENFDLKKYNNNSKYKK